jgi:hypothetical protein
MDYPKLLEGIADVASILTFLAGIVVWGQYRCERCQRKSELEKQLKQDLEVARKTEKKGQVSFLHLTTKTGLTESEILQASFKNPRIKRIEKLDDEGFVEKILFQYNDGN